MQQERPAERTVVSTMETSTDFQDFAAECELLAEEATNEEQRTILRRMAAAWRDLAEEYDRDHSVSGAR
jgi:hypothetical protein